MRTRAHTQGAAEDDASSKTSASLEEGDNEEAPAEDEAAQAAEAEDEVGAGSARWPCLKCMAAAAHGGWARWPCL